MIAFLSYSSTPPTSRPLIVLLFLIASTVVDGELSPSFAADIPDKENELIDMIMDTYMDAMMTKSLGNSDKKIDLSKDINNHISNHPALRQVGLWVKRRPKYGQRSFIADRLGLLRAQNWPRNDDETEFYDAHKFSKKSLFPSEEICQTERKWELINSTLDLYGNDVEIIQQDYLQYIFTYRCATPGLSCTGISSLYNSECEERKAWMYLYNRRTSLKNSQARWSPVAVPHHCACKLSRKIF